MEKLSKQIKEHFRELGSRGGSARMAGLSDEQKKRLARKAGKASGQSRRGTMKLLDASTGLMECSECGATHFANLAGGGRYVRGSWQCAKGCKK